MCKNNFRQRILDIVIIYKRELFLENQLEIFQKINRGETTYKYLYFNKAFYCNFEHTF